MASRNEKKLTIDDIWFITDNGRLIFEKELGVIPKKNISSPFRNGDSNPSFNVYIAKDGKYKFKDFGGDSYSGNAIDFIMILYNLSFKEAIKRIEDEFKGISVNIPKVITPVKHIKKSTVIEVNHCDWQQKHEDYWFGKYKLDKDFLELYNVIPIDKFSINGKIIRVPDDVMATAYIHEKGIKILQIGDNVTQKWINNVPNDALFFEPKEKCNRLWVVKSVKDALVMIKNFGFCCIAVQNEDAVHLERNIQKIMAMADEIVLCYGADEHGVKNCKIIQQKYNLKYFNTPKYLLKYNVEDVSDLIAEFGVEILKKELKRKQFV